MKTGLVLGGGGVVGLAYHAGVLRALETETGFRAPDADLIVGTSAGSVVGAYLRSGWTVEDFWLLALGEHPSLAAISAVDPSEPHEELLAPAFRTPLELLRRGLGSGFVLTRSLLRLPAPPVPAVLRHLFPGGMFAMTQGRRRFESELPDEWPDRDLWLTTVDISRGRRIVLGRHGSPAMPLPRAVTASCAIPGIYPPVAIGRMTLVDGGVWSPTNLDVAAKADCKLIVCVAPMAHDPHGAGIGLSQIARQVPTRILQREAAAARRGGAEVLLLRPSPGEVRAHGFNLMRPDFADRVARDAYEATARLLAGDRFRETVEHLSAA